MRRVLPVCVAAAAALALGTIGVVRGTYAAGGSDSSCYALMAEAFASGAAMPTSDLIADAPWPKAQATFAPGGFLPSPADRFGAAPVCAPGFSLLMAPFVRAAGPPAVFWLTPFAALVLIAATFRAGSLLWSPVSGALAAVLVAVSPPVIYQVVQPMNDITTTALWMAAFVMLIEKRWGWAGACCGLALLVRPNLLPLGAVAGLYVLWSEGRAGSACRRFAMSVVPFGLVVLWLNDMLYGSPLRSGYGQLDHLFAAANVPTNAANHMRWLLETHTVFPFVGIAAPALLKGETRSAAWLAIALAGATWGIYLFYTPFPEWTYLRFLLPAIGLLIVLASAVFVQTVERIAPARVPVLAAALAVGVGFFSVRSAADRSAFALKFLEQRYRSTGIVVRDRLPAGAIALSVWDSGAVRFHGRREALRWEALDPQWLDATIDWLRRRGRQPYIVVESWEELGFRRRFGDHSEIGKLDWPPQYEVDRLVRIYNPEDRARYHRGERIWTEYLWPLR